jgi:DNA-binding NtrC family response regulator
MSDHHTTETAAALPAIRAGVDATAWLTQVHPTPAAPLTLTGRTVVGRSPGKGLRCDDRRMSRKHFVIHRPRKDGPWRLEDTGTKNGTRVDGVQVESAWLTSGSVIRAGDSLFVFEGGTPPGGFIRPTPAGRSLALDWAHQMIDRVAPTELTVLIQGPTGAGKERLAERLHQASGRTGPFVPVNCTTLPQTLVASELFGHVRGAFSGADARSGLFAAAEGGTLFLDEVGDLPLAQQPMLLRALQERRIRPVGAETERRVDVRIVAATHRDLAAAVAADGFRADLFARLTELEVALPGLDARQVDVLPIFRALVGAPLSSDAAEALLVAPWPTNIRGLQRLARRIRLFADGLEQVESTLLPSDLQARVQTRPTPAQTEIPRADIEAQLTAHAGNVSRAARALGLTRQALYRRLQALDLDASRFR